MLGQGCLRALFGEQLISTWIKGERTWAIAIQTVLREPKFRTEFRFFFLEENRSKRPEFGRKRDLYEPLLTAMAQVLPFPIEVGLRWDFCQWPEMGSEWVESGFWGCKSGWKWVNIQFSTHFGPILGRGQKPISHPLSGGGTLECSSKKGPGAALTQHTLVIKIITCSYFFVSGINFLMNTITITFFNP